MHVLLILVAEFLQRASRRAGRAILLPIITRYLLKLPRISSVVFPTSLCGKIDVIAL